MSAGTVPSVVVTPVTFPPLCSMPMTLVDPAELRAPALRAARERDDDARGLGESVGFDVKAAEYPVGVEQRMQLRAFLRIDDPALDSPRRRPALPAVQFGEPRFGGRHLEAADLVEAPRAVDLERQELLDRV